jgi:hypothetical protein
MKCTRIGGKKGNCSCFEIDQEIYAILLIENFKAALATILTNKIMCFGNW